ncbi:MAG TPA: cupin domain-containing protein [Mycobacteriales bacterium]|jgi:mannose-6-phosphate isomerase-like protein (cupin superfamily)|nr:cupin domain-containing protein [Mycobacteriales bacterium]
MADLVVKNIDSPDEHRAFPANGVLDLVTLPGVTFARATFEPGWRWSTDIKPVAGTDSCQVHHNGYVISGRMGISMDDGSEAEVGPGDVFVCPPGHDAWTVGDEACVVADFSSAIAEYAKE